MRILLGIALLLPGLLYGQVKSHPVSEKTSIIKGLPPGVASIQVNYTTLMRIARKYDVNKNFEYKPRPANALGKPPKKVYLKMSLEQFDDWMKQLGFEEKKVKILNQFFLKDFQGVCTVKEYIALRRAYVKKYPVHLKDVESFQEARILQDEAHPELINLNTPCFQKKKKRS